MGKRGLIAALFLFLLSSWVSAQGSSSQGEDEWEISVFVGASGTDKGTFFTPVAGGLPRNVGLEFDLDYAAGARLTQNVGQHFAGELEYVFANQPASLTDLRPGLPVLDFSQKIHKFAYSLLLYATERQSNLRPFVSVGLGASFFGVSGDSKQEASRQGVTLDTQFKFAFSFGGGFKFKVRPWWGLRLDFRDYITAVPDYGLPSEAPILGVGFNPDGVLHNWYGSVGVVVFLSRQ